MHYFEYKDYEWDKRSKKQTLESGKGFNGIEMHERYGWGLTQNPRPKATPGLLQKLASLFGGKKK